MGEGDQGHRGPLRLPGVGGFLTDRLSDVIGLLASLPEIGATLRSINEHIVSIDAEVTEMRHGVNRLEVDVALLRGEIGLLRGEIGDIRSQVTKMDTRISEMEPNVEALGRLAGPLRRKNRKTRSADDRRQLAPARPEAETGPSAQQPTTASEAADASLSAIGVDAHPLGFDTPLSPPYADE